MNASKVYLLAEDLSKKLLISNSPFPHHTTFANSLTFDQLLQETHTVHSQALLQYAHRTAVTVEAIHAMLEKMQHEVSGPQQSADMQQAVPEAVQLSQLQQIDSLKKENATLKVAFDSLTSSVQQNHVAAPNGAVENRVAIAELLLQESRDERQKLKQRLDNSASCLQEVQAAHSALLDERRHLRQQLHTIESALTSTQMELALYKKEAADSEIIIKRLAKQLEDQAAELNDLRKVKATVEQFQQSINQKDPKSTREHNHEQ